MTSFRAPWSALLEWMSLLSTALLLIIQILFATHFPRDLLGGRLFALLLVLPPVLLLGTALFTVRGYELDQGELRVLRLVWATRIPLADLRSAWADPTAMRGSLRLFGNGGLFAIAGLYWNRRLGRYRAFATNPKNAVVLCFSARTVVVTPEGRREFLNTLALYGHPARVEGEPPAFS